MASVSQEKANAVPISSVIPVLGCLPFKSLEQRQKHDKGRDGQEEQRKTKATGERFPEFESLAARQREMKDIQRKSIGRRAIASGARRKTAGLILSMWPRAFSLVWVQFKSLSTSMFF
ncbi:unnamed protein product [Pleuronectes platessa]|uniref:Uncharacterized protein n=1 Tax=Pleuronectes platessa TaxID=8262 RepID=A0A9N7VDY9_PLEPL|nr:unnamed protein product [Pleuronectes platessa]